jgi:hypothetical protein
VQRHLRRRDLEGEKQRGGCRERMSRLGWTRHSMQTRGFPGTPMFRWTGTLATKRSFWEPHRRKPTGCALISRWAVCFQRWPRTRHGGLTRQILPYPDVSQRGSQVICCLGAFQSGSTVKIVLDPDHVGELRSRPTKYRLIINMMTVLPLEDLVGWEIRGLFGIRGTTPLTRQRPEDHRNGKTAA